MMKSFLERNLVTRYQKKEKLEKNNNTQTILGFIR